MEGYPVQEEQQDHSQMDTMLIKLQVELQQQLQPAQDSSTTSSTAAGHPADASCSPDAVSTRLVLTPLATMTLPAAPAQATESHDVTPGQDDVILQDAATDSLHSELTLRQSSASLDSGRPSPEAAADAGTPAPPAPAAADASMTDAISDALAHSIAAPVAPAALQAATAAALGATPAGLVPLLASRAASDRCLSGTEDEWHMVSRTTSVKAPSSSGRYSLDEGEAAAVAAAATAATAVTTAVGSTRTAASELSTGGMVSPFHATDGGVTDGGSECGSDITPRDELAASILGHPVMMAAAAAAAAAAAGGSAVTLSQSPSPVRPMSPAGLTAMLHDVAADGSAAVVAAGPAAQEAAVAAVGEPPAAGSNVAQGAEEAVVLDAQEALGLLSGGLLQLAGGLRDWLVESLAALVQTGRDSQAAAAARASSALRALQLSAKQSGGLAAAALSAAGDWRLLLSGTAAVVCLALWMKSRKEASLLRSMLRRRDHELSKLVMRVVSLQELINQGGHLQPSISRYSRYEASSGVTATYM